MASYESYQGILRNIDKYEKDPNKDTYKLDKLIGEVWEEILEFKLMELLNIKVDDRLENLFTLGVTTSFPREEPYKVKPKECSCSYCKIKQETLNSKFY